MADTLTSTSVTVDRPLGGVPFGNLTVLPFIATFLEGVWTLSDDATAVVHTDTLVLGKIPKGFKILAAEISVNAALGDTNSTLTIGWEYVDGVDVAAPNAEDADYFTAAQANTAAFSIRDNNLATKPVTLPKDAYLTVLVNTAAFLTTGSLTGDLIINVFGIADQA